MDQPRQEESDWTDGSRRRTDPRGRTRPSSDHSATLRAGRIPPNAQTASISGIRDTTLTSFQRNNLSSRTAGLMMGPDQPPTLSNDLLSWFQPPHIDEWHFQGGVPAERLLDPSYGTSMRPLSLQGNHLPEPSLSTDVYSYSIHTDNIPQRDTDCALLSLATPLQLQRGNASDPLQISEYPSFGQPLTLDSLPATGTSLANWQQSTLPQTRPDPHSRSQERTEFGLSDPYVPMDTSSDPPPQAATTSLPREPSESQANNLTASTVQGIELESPRPADGGTTARLRRDTCITLSFDMQAISRGIATYDGLKIPSTPSVRQLGSETGKKLLHLQIRVLGATTKAPYDTLCHECKSREGDRAAFPDFRARNDIRVPIKKGKSSRVPVAFILACCSNHRKPNDSEYRLEIILYGSAEHNNPLIQYELPYSFDIVTKLPPRTRDQAEDGDAMEAVVLPPQKVLRTISGHSGPVGNPSGPSRLAGHPPGDSRGLPNSIPPSISEVPAPPADNHNLSSPAEAPMLPRQSRQAVTAASDEETMDGHDAVIESTNPSRGPTTGGQEIWILGSNIPTGLPSLYARFGDKFAIAVVRRRDLLSCRLPSASVPGMVEVTLSRTPNPNAPVLGTSLCQFEYLTDLKEMLPVIIRIQEDCTPEVAAALDVLHKNLTRDSKRNGKRPMREGEVRDDEIETAIIQALAPLQDTLDFEELISKTNDYNQTLAHFAVLFGYINLLKMLVGWNIDLTIADVNGLTALHCAYMKGDRACVELLLEKGVSETVLDALGRAPSHLMPGGFNSLNTDIASGDQPILEQQPDALSPFQPTDSGHGAPDSDEEKCVNNTDRACGAVVIVRPSFTIPLRGGPSSSSSEEAITASFLRLRPRALGTGPSSSMSIFSKREPGRLDGVGLDWGSTGGWGGLEAAQSEQMDVCFPVASTSKAAFGDPKGRAQYSGGQRSQKNRRIPDVPSDPDINTFIPRLRERLAHTEAIEYLCKEVFPTGEISLAALRAPMDQTDEAQSAHMNEKYHGLLLMHDDSSCICRLCPRDNELRFDDDEEALHHITISHLDMGYGCTCGCGKTYWNPRELKCHLTRVAGSG